MSEENKAIVRRFLDELHNKRNLAIVDELAMPNYTGHGGGASTPEEVKQDASRRAAAFPDIQLTIEDQIAEGDKVVTRWTMRGKHQGEFQGIAPTGKEVTMTGTFIHRIEGGKLAERWVNADQTAMLQQLGAIPSQ